MNVKSIFWFFLALVLMVAIATGAWYVYSLGVAQGIVQSGNLPVPEAGEAPAPYVYGAPYYHAPYGGGPFFRPFGFMRCLVPLFFILLFLGLMRAAFGHRYMHSRGWRRGEGGVPPFFEDWHRRAHESHGPEKQADV